MGARHGMMFAALLCGALAPCAAAPDTTPLAFIGAFYRDYFTDQVAARKRYVDGGAFYTRAVSKLMAANEAACATIARTDNQCGYGVGGDEFFNAQEIDPALSLASSGFKARAAGRNRVDVSFRVFPDDAQSQRALRYLLLRENGQWRVDDVIYKENGGLALKDGMRYKLAAETASSTSMARDVDSTAQWLVLSSSMGEKYFARYARFPVSVCDKHGACLAYAENDSRLPALAKIVHDMPSVGDAATPRPRALRGAPKDGSVARSGPFDFVFERGAWWLTRVDLARAASR